jgi:ABC-type glycerol-3-phosphate transport system permease component
MRKIAKGLVYLLLVTGAAVFAFPFLWMASTSVKVDREVHSQDLQLIPQTPVPHRRSPYVDTRVHAGLEGPYERRLLSELESLVAATDFEFPARANAIRAKEQVARGLYAWLRQRLPRHLWEGRTADGDPLDEEAAALALAEAARREVTAETVATVFDGVYRRLEMGPIRIRSTDRVEAELGADRPLAERLVNRTPDVLATEGVVEKGEPFLLLAYDFTQGDRFALEGTYEVPAEFSLEDLHRISVDIRPDDTWHELWLTVEMNGVRYVSERAWPLATYDVTSAQWQPAGPDDHATKLKTWIRLVESARGEGVLDEPGRMRLRFEYSQVGRSGAWWNKLARNYRKVVDYMPFWRYLRVSLFLVVATVSLTVFVSSLVAYAFARISWPGRDLAFILMLATMMIPFQVVMIPRFLIWKNLGAYNTLTPLWLGPAFGGAFFIFLLRQFMKGIPRDLEDAARLDGCGFLRIYWHIILPLIKPSLAAIAIFTFLATWNNFMGPLIYIADQRLYPLAFGLYALSIQVQGDPALTMAGSFLMTVPVIVIFFLAQKYFIQGITLTGMKA